MAEHPNNQGPMSDSEKPLKIISFILSGLLMASAVIYFVFSQGDPVEAEVVMEYSAPDGLQPSGLLVALETLRKDEAFLKEVAFRSGLGSESEPDFAETVTEFARSLAFEPNFGESRIAIRCTHRNWSSGVKNSPAKFSAKRISSLTCESFLITFSESNLLLLTILDRKSIRGLVVRRLWMPQANTNELCASLRNSKASLWFLSERSTLRRWQTTSHTPRLAVGNLTILPVQALQCVQAQAN